MTNSEKIGEKPLIVLISVIASIIAIFVFITGYETVPELVQKVRGLTQTSTKMYDGFDNSTFDGKYDESLWEFEGTIYYQAHQANGVMVIEVQPGLESTNNALFPIKPHSWTSEQFNFLETKLKLDSSKRGQGSFIKIQAVAIIKEDYGWWVECQLKNSESTHTLYFCNVYSGEGWNSDKGYEYQTQLIEGEYDTWYVARIEIDPKTTECRFFLNGNMIGRHVPRDAEGLKIVNLFPQIGSWTDREESLKGYVDDVRIGQ